MRAALDVAKPDVVFHLAAQTFVPDALASPQETYEANVLGTARLLEAMRAYSKAGASRPRLVFVSSGEAYGAQPSASFPLDERTPFHPSNPYAASKAAAEMLVLGEAHAFGVDVVVARPFNHIGPGQSDRFVIANFARQLAQIASGGEPIMRVGNLDARRDFLDVRDVVRAYVVLARRGVSGEVYNICSGIARSIRDALAALIRVAHVAVEVRDDPARMRPSDVPLFVGSYEKLRSATGWAPQISFEHSIRDIFAAARKTSAP